MFLHFFCVIIFLWEYYVQLWLWKLLQSLLKDVDSLLQCAVVLSARGIEVSATIEILSGELVAREGALRTKRHADEFLLGVLAQEGREVDALHLQGDVDESLGVALDEVETAHLLATEGDEGGMMLGEHAHLLVENIAHEAEAPFGVVVEHLIVDAVLVDILLQQEADDEVEVLSAGSVGEVAGVGHETGVEALAGRLAEVVVVAHGVDEAEHNLAGGREVRIRELERAEGVGLQVVIDEDLGGLGALDDATHVVDATQTVVVHGKDDVGSGEHELGLVAMLVEAHDILRTGHPSEEVGEGVGHHHKGLLTEGLQVMGHAEGGAEGVAVGTSVAGENKEVVIGNEALELRYVGLRKDIFNHSCANLTRRYE